MGKGHVGSINKKTSSQMSTEEFFCAALPLLSRFTIGNGKNARILSNVLSRCTSNRIEQTQTRK